MPDEQIANPEPVDSRPVVINIDSISGAFNDVASGYIGENINAASMASLRSRLEDVMAGYERAGAITGRISVREANLSSPADSQPTIYLETESTSRPRLARFSDIARANAAHANAMMGRSVADTRAVSQVELDRDPPVAGPNRNGDPYHIGPMSGHEGRQGFNRGGDAFVNVADVTIGLSRELQLDSGHRLVEHKAREFNAAVQRKLDVQPDRVESLEMSKPCQGCNEHICVCPVGEVRGYYNPPISRIGPDVNGRPWEEVMYPRNPEPVIDSIDAISSPAGEVPLTASREGNDWIARNWARDLSQEIDQRFVETVTRNAETYGGNNEPSPGS